MPDNKLLSKLSNLKNGFINRTMPIRAEGIPTKSQFERFNRYIQESKAANKPLAVYFTSDEATSKINPHAIRPPYLGRIKYNPTTNKLDGKINAEFEVDLNKIGSNEAESTALGLISILQQRQVIADACEKNGNIPNNFGKKLPIEETTGDVSTSLPGSTETVGDITPPLPKPKGFWDKVSDFREVCSAGAEGINQAKQQVGLYT